MRWCVVIAAALLLSALGCPPAETVQRVGGDWKNDETSKDAEFTSVPESLSNIGSCAASGCHGGAEISNPAWRKRVTQWSPAGPPRRRFPAFERGRVGEL